MNRNFEGRVALIAGASGGIGRAVARRMADEGSALALQYRGNRQAIDSLLTELPADRTIAVQADVTDASSWASMVEAVLERFGHIDIFVSTIGYTLRMAGLLEISDEAIDDTIAVELRGAITSTRGVLDAMVQNGGGRIVFVGSDSGKVGTTGEAVSAACRGGLIAFTKSVAREFARHNILANVVCPGPTDTDLWKGLIENDNLGHALGDAMVKATPLRRIANADEVAAAVVFLASPDASFVTGQAWSVSGGLTMV